MWEALHDPLVNQHSDTLSNLLALLAAASDRPSDLGRAEPAQSLSGGGDGPVRSQTAAPNSVSRSSYSLSQE